MRDTNVDAPAARVDERIAAPVTASVALAVRLLLITTPPDAETDRTDVLLLQMMRALLLTPHRVKSM